MIAPAASNPWTTPPATAPRPRAIEAREAATRFVSTAFITPVFAQLRETNDAAAPFAPGAAEKHFGPLLDQMLADRLTSAANFPLVDAVLDRLEVRP